MKDSAQVLLRCYVMVAIKKSLAYITPKAKTNQFAARSEEAVNVKLVVVPNVSKLDRWHPNKPWLFMTQFDHNK